MGFAVIPDLPKDGVYVHREHGFLIVVTAPLWPWWLEILYKKNQKQPKKCNLLLLRECEYVGEMD